MLWWSDVVKQIYRLHQRRTYIFEAPRNQPRGLCSKHVNQSRAIGKQCHRHSTGFGGPEAEGTTVLQ